ncbi:MAG: ClpX C4-type zinc finger protein [Deltaproteobacteria bacterium]|nr:ClpX C4-type zinc finger protein [Deltaproteobacteria bacterium]
MPVAPPPGPCSFCGKRRDEVGSLLGARLEPAVCICDECLALCQEILAEQDTGDRPSSSGGQMLAAQRWVQIGGQQVEIAIQIPQEALGGSWSCGWSLQGPDWYEQQTAYGADSLEALERALQAVRERQAAIAWPGGKDEDGGASPPGGSTGSR